MASPSQNLAAIIAPVVNSSAESVKQLIETRQQEILVAIEGLNTRLSLVEQLIGGSKKKTTSKKAADGDVAAVAAVANETAVVKSSFPVNKMLYFRHYFEKDLTFRKQYMLPELEKAIKEDPKVINAKSPKAANTQTNIIAWNFVKNHKELYARIGAEYDAAKKANEAKAVAETVEEATPE